MLKYPLLEPLLVCTEEEINAAFEYMDNWIDMDIGEFTLKLFWTMFPQFSGGESEVIFDSWMNAKK
jgi:hypothetical protein